MTEDKSARGGLCVGGGVKVGKSKTEESRVEDEWQGIGGWVSEV